MHLDWGITSVKSAAEEEPGPVRLPMPDAQWKTSQSESGKHARDDDRPSPEKGASLFVEAGSPSDRRGASCFAASHGLEFGSEGHVT